MTTTRYPRYLGIFGRPFKQCLGCITLKTATKFQCSLAIIWAVISGVVFVLLLVFSSQIGMPLEYLVLNLIMCFIYIGQGLSATYALKGIYRVNTKLLVQYYLCCLIIVPIYLVYNIMSIPYLHSPI